MSNPSTPQGAPSEPTPEHDATTHHYWCAYRQPIPEGKIAQPCDCWMDESEPDWLCRHPRSHGPCNTPNDAESTSCGACGEDRPSADTLPETSDAERRLADFLAFWDWPDDDALSAALHAHIQALPKAQWKGTTVRVGDLRAIRASLATLRARVVELEAERDAMQRRAEAAEADCQWP